jgi:hypothetical protein
MISGSARFRYRSPAPVRLDCPEIYRKEYCIQHFLFCLCRGIMRVAQGFFNLPDYIAKIGHVRDRYVADCIIYITEMDGV